ncbi:hypothetical protein ACX6VP_004649, partial [Yersinia enterocolitica]
KKGPVVKLSLHVLCSRLCHVFTELLHHLRLTRQQDNDQPPVGLNNLCLDTMLHDEVTNGVNVWFGCEEETENF